MKEAVSISEIYAPRGLSRKDSARYVGISPTLFDQLVKDGRMPNPKRINSRTLWDRKELDFAFEELPGAPIVNPWDGHAHANEA